MVSEKDKMSEQHRIEVENLQRRIAELEVLDSKRRQTEGRLKEAEQLLQAVIDLAPDAYYLSDLKGTFIDGNKAAEKIIGYKKEELIGKSFLKLDLLSVKQIPKATDLLARNAIGKATGPDEFMLKRKGGSLVPVQISTVPIKMSSKTIVLGIVHDITETKKLEDTEEQFRFIFDNINDAIISLDETGRIDMVSARVKDIFGVKPEQVIGQNFTSLGVFNAKDMPKVMQMFGGVMKGDVPQLVVIEPKLRDGRVIKVEASTRIIKKGNTIERILVVVRDITGRE